MKPLTIIGAGLSGLALGIRLRQLGIPVRILEAGTLPRHRVCGEFITGLKPNVREALQLDPVLNDALKLRKTRWYRGTKPVLARSLPEPAVGISRYALDERMAKVFSDLGGQLDLGHRYLGEAVEGMIWASGRRANARSPWVGLKAHVRGFRLEADLELHLSPGGYAGASAVESGAVNICGLFRIRDDVQADRNNILPAYLAACGLHGLADRFQKASVVPDSLCSVAGLDYRHFSWPGRPSVGDRFALIPPFTGHGMAIALESGMLAASSLAGFSSGELTWSQARHNLLQAQDQAFSRRIRGARLLHALILNRFMLPLLGFASFSGLFPFRSLYRLTHA